MDLKRFGVHDDCVNLSYTMDEDSGDEEVISVLVEGLVQRIVTDVFWEGNTNNEGAAAPFADASLLQANDNRLNGGGKKNNATNATIAPGTEIGNGSLDVNSGWEEMTVGQHLIDAKNYLQVLKLFIQYMGHEVPVFQGRKDLRMYSGKFENDFSDVAQDDELCEVLNCTIQLQEYTVREGIEIPLDGVPPELFLDENGWPRDCIPSGQVYGAAIVRKEKKRVQWKADNQTNQNAEKEIEHDQIDVEIDEAFNYLMGNGLNEGISAMMIDHSVSSDEANEAGVQMDDIPWDEFLNVSILPSIDNDSFKRGGMGISALSMQQDGEAVEGCMHGGNTNRDDSSHFMATTKVGDPMEMEIDNAAVPLQGKQEGEFVSDGEGQFQKDEGQNSSKSTLGDHSSHVMVVNNDEIMQVEGDLKADQASDRMEEDRATCDHGNGMLSNGQASKVRWTKSKIKQWRATRGGHSSRI